MACKTGDEACSASSGEELGTTSGNALSCNASTIDKVVNNPKGSAPIISRTGEELLALSDLKTAGVIVFQTFSLLDAYAPVNSVEEKGSFKVTNDTDTSLNGYYSWVSGTTYSKDASLVENVIDENNTSDAVSGKAVAVHTSIAVAEPLLQLGYAADSVSQDISGDANQSAGNLAGLPDTVFTNNEVFTGQSYINSITLNISTAGNGEVLIYEVNSQTDYILTKVVPVSVSAGLQTIDLSPYNLYVGTGGFIGYRPIVGHLKYGPQNTGFYSNVIGDLTEGSLVTLQSDFSYPVAIEINYLLLNIDSVDEQLGKANREIVLIENTLEMEYIPIEGDKVLVARGTSFSPSDLVADIPFTEDTTVTKFRIVSPVDSEIKIRAYSKDGSNFTATREITVNALSGENEFKIEFQVLAGEYLGKSSTRHYFDSSPTIDEFSSAYWHSAGSDTPIGVTGDYIRFSGPYAVSWAFDVSTSLANANSTRLDNVEEVTNNLLSSQSVIPEIQLVTGAGLYGKLANYTYGDLDTPSGTGFVPTDENGYAATGLVVADGFLDEVIVDLIREGTFFVGWFKPTTGSNFELVGETKFTDGLIGSNTLSVSNGLIPASVEVKNGWMIGFRHEQGGVAGLRYYPGPENWAIIIGYDGTGQTVTRSVQTNGFAVAMKVNYAGISEPSLDDRLITLEEGGTGTATKSYVDQAEEDAIIRVGINYGLSPLLTEMVAYGLGDSTVAEYSGRPAILELTNTVRIPQYVAVPGDTIAGQLADWNALTIVPSDVGYVVVQIGLNDMNPSSGTTLGKIAELQNLVDTIRTDIGTLKPIFISKMLPARQRFINLWGEVDGEAGYQRWLAVNEAVAGLGSNPITGVQGRIVSHEADMNDGSGNLKAEYDTGDAIHPNTAGRQLMADAWNGVVRDVYGLVV